MTDASDEGEDAGDLREEIAAREAEIEALSESAERCRKIMLASQAAILLGGLLLIALVLGFVRTDAMGLLVSFAAIIGGIVVFGSNASTARQMAERIAEAERERAELIAGMKLRVIDAEQAPAIAPCGQG